MPRSGRTLGDRRRLRGVRTLAARLSAVSLALAPALIAAAVPAEALACSVQAGYRAPTNLELVAAANTIVLGQVVGETASAADPGAGAIQVRPIAAIKGLMPGEALVLHGMALRQPGDPGPAAPIESLDFAAPHPDALTGACIRRVFPPGARVLFFLSRMDGGWTPAGGPFSRWAEDVPGLEAPWAQLVLLYAHAAQLGPQEREALLQDQLEALQARTDEPAALAMAADIERSMAAPAFPEIRETAPSPVLPEPAPADELGELGARIDALRQEEPQRLDEPRAAPWMAP